MRRSLFPEVRPETPGGPHPPRVVTTQGSGFFISADGYAVTNNHVVANAQSLEVATDDGNIRIVTVTP